MQFDPKKVMERLEALEKREVSAIGATLEERLAALEAFAEKVLPILPLLQEKNAGQVAGTGAAETEGVVIPATELGEYKNPPQPAAEGEAAADPKPAA